jgi:hypothetical protein
MVNQLQKRLSGLYFTVFPANGQAIETHNQQKSFFA